MPRAAIGIDFGGTKIEGVVLVENDSTPSVLVRKRIKTDQSAGPERIARQVVDLINELGAGRGELPVGCGMPGSVDGRGLVKNSNTVCLNGTDFRGSVNGKLGRPVRFSNDADCFALAEAMLGAGRGRRVVFGVIMGTGVGGGVCVDGLAAQGPNSIRGEWGHNQLYPASDRICYCGRRGCVETYLAGPWLEWDYRRRGGGGSPSVAEVIARRAKGDPIAGACVDTWLRAFGSAVSGVINVLDPDVIVLGGGLSNVEMLYDEGRALVAEHVFSDELLTPISKNENGDSAGVLGAALTAF